MHATDKMSRGALAIPPALAIAALRNLLDNARRHTRGGTVVCLTLEQFDESKARFTVQDQGPGIASELVERFTERFWRSSQDDGSGLAFFYRGGGACFRACVRRWPAQILYLLGGRKAAVAAVIDPRHNTDIYLQMAK
ncbi:ATP-binding protein [Pseudomonas sp.]|uniref:ATP-binding protein n=1 Tax=Pseudomonas sp. TaxID=306 RepID=UPI00299CF805|nr:ATP-binding protein [Pseudomonas sp.]MDX1368190.1 ATP-binding protein [Pseudomonas sp.]